MTALDIIRAIIALNKDFDRHDIQEMIFGKARMCDLEFIKDEIWLHMSSNEENAARYAMRLIEECKL